MSDVTSTRISCLPCTARVVTAFARAAAVVWTKIMSSLDGVGDANMASMVEETRAVASSFATVGVFRLSGTWRNEWGSPKNLTPQISRGTVGT